MCSIFRVRFLAPAAALCLSGLLLLHPHAAAEGFAQGIALCVHTLLPALFPFFVTCSLVTASCGRRGSFGTALLLSWLGGYAVCAGLIHDLHTQGKLSPRRTQLLLLLGCCSGPGFVIGSVGGQLLGSAFSGFLLYTAQLIANLLCALVLRPLLGRYSAALPCDGISNRTRKSAATLSSAITGAVNSCLSVSGTVIFFRILQRVWADLFPDFSFLSPLVSAILEISAGCADFAQRGSPFALPGICLCMSILGISVFTQLHAILQGAADLKLLLVSRLLHIPFMLVLVRVGVRLLPAEAAVFSSLAPRVIPSHRVAPDAAFVTFLFLCAVLYKIRKKNYN